MKNIADFGMDTITMAGSLPSKLAAVRDAGFEQVMLSARDLTSHEAGVDAAIALVKGSGLRVTGFQVLREFEGLTGPLHDYKLGVARSMLTMCAALGCRVLLACSSTSPHASLDAGDIARDLRKLAMLALPLRVNIAYEALSWGRAINEYTQAWDVVSLADMPNLGIALDTYHAFATQTPLDYLEDFDTDKIFLVQLSDLMWEVATPQERMETARHARVFPGDGIHSDALADLLRRLDGMGYRGDYSLEVFNDDYLQLPPATVASHARRSALWLAEDVLRRSVPLPGAMKLRASSIPTSR
jgi:sugar phosphate isomerase/epimerase